MSDIKHQTQIRNPNPWKSWSLEIFRINPKTPEHLRLKKIVCNEKSQTSCVSMVMATKDFTDTRIIEFV